MKALELFNEIVQRGSFQKETKTLPFNLPRYYVELLQNYDVSIVKNSKIRVYINEEKRDFVYLVSIFNHNELIRLYNQFYFQFPDSQIIENELTLIGETSAPLSICMGIGNSNFGQIFIFGWDLGINKVSNSLEEFIDCLQPESEVS
jgi:hypothetical protein